MPREFHNNYHNKYVCLKFSMFLPYVGKPEADIFGKPEADLLGSPRPTYLGDVWGAATPM